MEHVLDIADSSLGMSNKGPVHAEAPPSRSGDFARGGGVALDLSTGSQVSPSSPTSFWTSYFSSCLGRRHDCRSSWRSPGSPLGDSRTVFRFSTSLQASGCSRRGGGTNEGDQEGWIFLS